MSNQTDTADVTEYHYAYTRSHQMTGDAKWIHGVVHPRQETYAQGVRRFLSEAGLIMAAAASGKSIREVKRIEVKPEPDEGYFYDGMVVAEARFKDASGTTMLLLTALPIESKVS